MKLNYHHQLNHKKLIIFLVVFSINFAKHKLRYVFKKMFIYGRGEQHNSDMGVGKKILVAFSLSSLVPPAYSHSLSPSVPPRRSPVSAVHCLSLVAATGRPPPLPYARIPGCIFRTPGFQAAPFSFLAAVGGRVRNVANPSYLNLDLI